MKIHLALLENDKSYLNRIISVFNTKYADKLEIYSFTEKQTALSALRAYRIDVLLAGESFDIEREEVPPRCGFAYLVDTADIESVRGEAALCKFQKAELIYKQILSIFSDKTSAITGVGSEHAQGGKVIAFFSVSGGTGCSTAAAAGAIFLARKGKKVLYLNLETFGNPDLFFQGEGHGTFEDIIYAVKSKKSNLYLKLESVVRRDETGVFFFSKTPVALDMNELKEEEIRRIVAEARTSCEYEYIILDMAFSFQKERLGQFCECSQVVMVSDGSVISNNKAERMLEALEIMERQQDKNLLGRLCILYNRFSSHTSEKFKNRDIHEIGGIKRYEGYEIKDLLQELSRLPVFDSII